jgi:hypothetical protein
MGAAFLVVGDNIAARICDIISTEWEACSAMSARPIGAGALMLSFDMYSSRRQFTARFTLVCDSLQHSSTDRLVESQGG